MRIRDIEVRDFRKLRHVLVSGLKDGVNVITGENEGWQVNLAGGSAGRVVPAAQRYRQSSG